VTIGDINILSEMNRAIRNQQDKETEIRTNERYNLQTRPKIEYNSS